MWHSQVAAPKDVAGTFDEVGSTATLVVKLLDGLHDFHIEVTAAEPGRMSTHVGQQLDGPMRYTSTVRYTPAGSGFDWRWDEDNELPDGLPGPFGSEALLARFKELTLSQSAEVNKMLLEAMVPQPA